MKESNFKKCFKENPQYHDIVNLIRKKCGGTLSTEVKNYLMDSLKRNNQQFLATKNWIHRTQTLSHKILKGQAPNAEFVLWWIYIYGLIFELYEKEEKTRDITMLMPWRRPFLEALDNLHESLTKSERSYVRFMRHNHVHILVDYPWQRIKVKQGKIRKVFKAHDPEAIENAKQILSNYNDNQNEVALNFIKNIIDEIDSVANTFAEATN